MTKSIPIPLRMREIPEWGSDVQPGDCWYAIENEGKWCMYTDPERGLIIQAQVAPEHKGKRPLIVVLPNGEAWCVHAGSTRAGSGWQVSGDPPQITVRPSIAMTTETSWHGWIRDGQLVTC